MRFPDVANVLTKMQYDEKLELVMFSNGSHVTLRYACSAHNILSSVFPSSKVLSVGDVKAYKPSQIAYKHLLKSVGKLGDPEDCILISCNPFDICGAGSMGMRSVWIDRTNSGWKDQLGGGPTWTFTTFSELLGFEPQRFG